MRELESIRQFLTGNAITLVLDLVFSVVFIAVSFRTATLGTLAHEGVNLIGKRVQRLYVPERIVQNNMKSICQGRSVLIVAHRLSAVRDANRIIELERGQIVEQGSHAELLAHEAGHYARLYRMQQG